MRRGAFFAELNGEMECQNNMPVNRPQDASTPVTTREQKMFVSRHLASNFMRLTHFSEDRWRKRA